MNRKKALELFKENLEKYQDGGFLFHPLFVVELGKLINDAQGNEKKIFELLAKQLVYVKELRRDVHKVAGNEILSHMNRDYYSLHLHGKTFNIRLLMSFDSKENPRFLAAFYERSGKKKSGYYEYKDLIDSRFKELGD